MLYAASPSPLAAARLYLGAARMRGAEEQLLVGLAFRIDSCLRRQGKPLQVRTQQSLFWLFLLSVCVSSVFTYRYVYICKYPYVCMYIYIHMHIAHAPTQQPQLRSLQQPERILRGLSKSTEHLSCNKESPTPSLQGLLKA